MIWLVRHQQTTSEQAGWIPLTAGYEPVLRKAWDCFSSQEHANEAQRISRGRGVEGQEAWLKMEAEARTAALGLSPDHPEWRAIRAHFLYDLKDYEGAIAENTRALAAEPTLVDALVNRAADYAAMNRIDEALADLRRAAKEGPDPVGIGADIALLEQQHLRNSTIAADASGKRSGRKLASDILAKNPIKNPLLAAVLAGLVDSDAKTSAAAAVQLQQYRGSLVEAVPALTALLADEDVGLAWQAGAAFARMGPDGAAAMPELLRLLDDSNATLRAVAATALGASHIEPSQVVPALAKLLTDKETGPRNGAVRALGAYGKNAAATADAVALLLADADTNVRLGASVTLFQITGDATRSVAVLHKMLREGEPVERVCAACALGQIGPPAKAARQDILRLADEQQFGKEPLLEAVRRIDGAAP